MSRAANIKRNMKSPWMDATRSEPGPDGLRNYTIDGMDVETLQKIPPWEWPKNAGKLILRTLQNRNAVASYRIIAAELAGEFVVIDDELCAALLAIVSDAGEADELRGKAAISLGPALESADTGDFDDPDDVPVTEDMFDRIQETLRKVYADETVPKEVRRRVLEASVRAPEDWHQRAVSDAYAKADREWTLTAVFASSHMHGFDEQILQALNSTDEEIHYQGVNAAGLAELDAAWPHIKALLTNARTPKPLLLAAIEAASTIRPAESRLVLGGFIDSKDEEISIAAMEAMGMAEGLLKAEDDEEDDEDERSTSVLSQKFST